MLHTPPKHSFHDNNEAFLHFSEESLFKNQYRICFRAQANEIVAENTRNRFDYQIWQTGLRNKIYW